MLTFRQWVEASGLTLREIAGQLANKLKRPVSTQNVFRWSRPFDDAQFAVPRPDVVVAIRTITQGKVTPESWYAHHGTRQPAARAAARRKAAAS